MTKGIHHITAIASDAQKNVHFYSKLLGLRLVKKTVNQDDVETYHLFFGDRYGHPGMDLTFFIFRPPMQGRRGSGLVTTISLAVPETSLQFWLSRFDSVGIKHTGISERFGHSRVTFYDEDEQQLELVAVPDNELDRTQDVWVTQEVAKEQAIRSFYSATLSVVSNAAMAPILQHVFGYALVATEHNVHLYRVNDSTRASFLEVHEEPAALYGLNAAGTVHHIAFRAKDEAEQLSMRQKVEELGLYPTEVIDRFYFKSVYFRTPSGILFEIATDEPGFTADEKEETLGERLSLPPFLEHERAIIEAQLPPVHSE